MLPGANSGDGGLLVAQKVSLTQPARLQSLSFYVTATSGQLRLALYDASGPTGQPGQKIAETVAFTPVVGWNTQPATSPVLAAGSYWIAYAPSSSALAFRSAWGVGNYCYMPVTFGTLPQTFSAAPACGLAEWSMYATLAPSSTPPPPPPPPPPATGTATLTWDPATDPSVTGWRVYWGTAPRTYAQPLGSGVLVTGSPTYIVTALPAGTHYFAVTAVAADGRESAYSNEASKTIP